MAEQRPSRIVKNKDILLIQEIPLLKIDIISLEQRKKWERSRMDHITQNISSTAGGGGSHRGMDDALANIGELEEKHSSIIKQYTQAVRKAEKIINKIPSHQMRTFVTLMYLDNMPDSAVQAMLHMSRWAFENARKTVEDAPSMEAVAWNDRYIAEG